MKKEYDYIVIGAGASGLSFAALMEKNGFTVAVLEAHSLPGGCSSYFERDGYIFDAGATTLSGLKSGRPLERLMKELDLQLELVAIDPGIISLIGDKKINRFRDFEKWMTELNKNFPEINHRKLWNKLKNLEIQGWDLSSNFKNIPLRSFSSLFSFFSKKVPGALLTAPSLFRSVDSEIKKHNITNPDYLKMIDELLFITAQNDSLDTPLLMGAMGLCYPEDTAYAIGGMKAFSQSLASKCSHLFFKHQVQKIVSTPMSFEVKTNHESFKAKNLVSTIPIWNHAELFDDPKAQNFFAKTKMPETKDCWSAFMIYLTIPQDFTRAGLYYQIHSDNIPHCHTKSFFVSLSHPDDRLRSLHGRQVVTISTHTKYSEWVNLDQADYKRKKEESKNFIFQILKEKFQLQDSDLQNVLTGSPKTFVKYTKRYSGLVGGIPHSLKRNPLDFIIARSPYDKFYMLGDTQFPGQGIAAVVLGSLNLVDYLKTIEGH